MSIIKFRFDDGDIGSYHFPLTPSNLKSWFPNGTVKLLNNRDTPWLNPFNNQTVNAYDLNMLCEICKSLNHVETQKLNALCSKYQINSINHLIHIIKHLHYYGLISSFEVYAAPILLAQELVAQHYPKGIPDIANEDMSDRAWQKRGEQAKTKLKHQITDYGWLFELESLPEFNDREIPVLNLLSEEPLVRLRVTDTESNKTLSLTLPTYIDDFDMNLLRLNPSLDQLTFHYENISLDENLWKSIEPVIKSTSPDTSHCILHDINELNSESLEMLETICTTIKLASFEELYLILESLYEFELDDTNDEDPARYARMQLDDLMLHDFNRYQQWLSEYLDYEAVGKRMLRDEFRVQTRRGQLKIPDSVAPLFRTTPNQGKTP